MIEHIRVDPDAGTPLYLGTNGGGFYRSSDGGRQWEQAVQGMAGIEPRAVVPAPDDPERVYFTAVDGAFHSNSGGLTWAKGEDGEMWVAAVDQRTAWWPMAAHGDRAPSARPPTGG